MSSSGSKNILDLQSKEVKEFFMKNESYTTLELPPYFNFEPLLEKIKAIRKKPAGTPWESEKTNHTLFTNKDGRYAWRPIDIIHPVLYIDLINIITEEENWKFIQNRFIKLKENSENIVCYSIPVQSLKSKKKTAFKIKRKDKAEQILKWWELVEQKSIVLSLDYEHILHTDIGNCYGSIYTHSIAWALHDRKVAKEGKKDPSLLGNRIDNSIKSMRYGQTNGIPQGSVVMNLIAEMVLSYIDTLISSKIQKFKIEDFKIIRYRDDYRIFTNNLSEGETILKIITECMIEVGLSLNSKKTKISSDVIRSSIKQGKLASIERLLEKSLKYSNLQKSLLVIHGHSKEYPNCRSSLRYLQKFHKILKNQNVKKHKILPLISIAVDIAFCNTNTHPIVVSILSELVSKLKEEERVFICKKIHKKFQKLTNVGHMEIWLQRLSIKYDPSIDFKEKLTKVVGEEQSKVDIWNNDWVKNKNLEELLINRSLIIDTKCMMEMKTTIQPEEVDIFNNYYY